MISPNAFWDNKSDGTSFFIGQSVFFVNHGHCTAMILVLSSKEFQVVCDENEILY